MRVPLILLSAALTGGCACLLAPRPARGSPEAEALLDSLSQRVTDARSRGDYEGALAAARDVAAAARSAAGAAPYRLQDAQIELATIERIGRLPAPDRKEIAEADRLGDEIDEACAKGEYARADTAARRALAIRQRILGENHTDTAESENDLASVLHLEGRYDEAADLEARAVATARSIYGDSNPKVALALGALALDRKEEGELAQAELLLDEALAVDRRILGPVHMDLAHLLDQLAALRQARGDFAGAEAHYREALTMRVRLLGGDDPALALNLNNLAVSLCSEGDFAAAEPLYRRALEIQRRRLGPNHPDVATSLNNLGFLFQVQGDYPAAEKQYREALEVYRASLGPAHPAIAKCLSNLGNALELEGDAPAAGAMYEEALGMYRQLFGPESLLAATTLAKLARLREEGGDPRSAEPLYRESLAIREKLLGPNHPDVAATREGLAALRREEGDPDGAETLYREALRARLATLAPENPAVVQNRIELGRLLAWRGDARGAARLLRDAARGYEAARVRVGSGLARAAFLDSPYPALAGAELALGRKAQAWEAVERAQGRVLAEFLLASRERLLDPVEQAREDSLLGQLTILEERVPELQQALRHGGTNEERKAYDEASNRLLAAEARWSALREEIEAKHPLTEGGALPLARIQAALDPATAIVGWLDADGARGRRDSWAYVVRGSGPVRWTRLAGGPASSGSAADPARSFREALVAAGRSALGGPPSAAPIPAAGVLWERRFAPLDASLAGIARLVVIPSGPMLGLPVEALTDRAGRRLGDLYAVSYAPSATVFAWLAENAPRRQEGATPALLVGDPPLRGGADSLAALAPLVWSRREIEDLARVLPGADTLLGPQASEQEIVRRAESGDLRRYRVIHLATHALIDDRRPERSAIVLSLVDLPDRTEAALEGRRIYDGLLTAREIVREWRLDAELVTLSACETALGKQVAGEGTIGLAYALLQAGAHCVLVSLWNVNDRATSLLMRRFYEDWMGKPSMSKADALREAKGWLRAYRDGQGRTPFADAYYWAPFILIGDAR